jgi:thioredoxin reductase
MGYTPNVEDIIRLFEEGGVGSIKLTQAGYIATDQYLRTSISHIYAAGDVANTIVPSVATAVAQGAIAARSLEEDLLCGV